MSESSEPQKIVIVGGGLVGMAAALKLSNSGIETYLVEAKLPDLEMRHSSYDSRTLVVNPASKQFWQQLGVWQSVVDSATAINQVHVSNKGRFGRVLFDKDELDVSALGHVVEAAVLGAVLWERVKQSQRIQVVAPAELLNFDAHEDFIDLKINTDGQVLQIKAQLLIAADGAQSAVRTQLKLPTKTKSYEKSAIICNISTERPHQHRAFERLTKSGPFALLPFNGRMGLVWSNSQEKANMLMGLSESEFIDLAQNEFGYRLGKFTQVGQRFKYPLYQIQVEQQYDNRVVLLGNAAHTVSPVSAQGLNLAIRGVKRLGDVLEQANQNGEDLGTIPILKSYQEQSQADQDQILDYTDDLMTWFKIDEPIINGLKSMAFLAIDSQIDLKKKLFRLAGGLNH